jgi:toxin ParE1/3/4
MKVTFLEEAQSEFLAAISYYEEARAGLGQQFREEVDRSVLGIAEHPDLCRLRSGGYRRMNLRVFPYYLPYVIRAETLWILAVAHGSRRPQYWIQRKQSIH